MGDKKDKPKKKNKGGRPTKYSKAILTKSKKYIKSCVDKEYDWTKTDGESSTSFEHRVKVKLPTIEGLAIYLDVSRKTLYNWAKENKEFLYTLGIIERKQKERLISAGLSGDYNPTIAKLILSTNHGMSEKSEIEHSGSVSLGDLFDKANEKKDDNK